MKFLPIIIFILYSCNNQQNKKINSENNEQKTYCSKKDFGGIKNSIPIKILDSIINALPYWRLNQYKTTDFGESLAVEFLKKELEKRGNKIEEFIILNINKNKDCLYEFHINHIDSYVYWYNLEKTNSELAKKTISPGIIEEILPITGNISGNEGWYIINMEKKTLEIILAQ